MKILIGGLCGHMGAEVAKLALEGCRGAELCGGVDIAGESTVPVSRSWEDAPASFADADCIIDFSHHTAVSALLDYAEAHGIAAVVATTGHTEEEKERIRSASERIPVFFAANMSVGVALLAELAKKAAAAMPDAEIEIVEKHHDRKLDAPSGTALMLVDAVREVRPEAYAVLGRSGHGKRTKEEIGVHAIRMGNIVGEHEIIIGTQNQTLTLKHEAHSRALFAEGALAAAEYLVKQGPGLYDMKSMLAD